MITLSEVVFKGPSKLNYTGGIEYSNTGHCKGCPDEMVELWKSQMHVCLQRQREEGSGGGNRGK